MDLTCCCHFPRNSAPLNESCKVLLHLLKDASLKERYNFPKKKQLFPDMCHFFGTWILQKWCYATTCVQKCNTIYFKRVLYPLKDFLWKQDLFKVLLHLLYPLQRSRTFQTHAPHIYSMCPILLQRSTASIQGLSPQVRFFKYCCIYWSIPLRRNVTFSQKKTTIPPIESISQFISFWSIRKRLVTKAKMCEGCFTAAVHNSSKTNLPSSLSGFKIQNWRLKRKFLEPSLSESKIQGPKFNAKKKLESSLSGFTLQSWRLKHKFLEPSLSE